MQVIGRHVAHPELSPPPQALGGGERDHFVAQTKHVGTLELGDAVLCVCVFVCVCVCVWEGGICVPCVTCVCVRGE